MRTVGGRGGGDRGGGGAAGVGFEDRYRYGEF